MEDIKEQLFKELKEGKKEYGDEFEMELEYEKACHPFADQWYKNNLNAEKVERYDYNDPVGHYMQKCDIDCTVHMKDPDGTKLSVNISEKFRREDWGDMFIELYSLHPSVPGWAIESKNVDLIAYFGGEITTYLVNAKAIKQLAEEILPQFDKISEEDMNRLIDIGWKNDIVTISSISNKNIKYKCNVKYIRAYTTRKNGSKWMSIGVCINWDALRKIGVKINEIDNYAVNG